jgi:hypothetical protein
MTEELSKLYQEKLAITPKAEFEKKKKKIKKKDIKILDIEERELQYYEYEIIDGIKIYNGIITDIKDEISRNIGFFKKISTHDKFTNLYPSTLTSRGNLLNTNFTEETFLEKLQIPSIKYASILKIGCNFGEIYTYPNPFMNHDIETIIKSIQLLKGNNIKIGCSCNEKLIDVKLILELDNTINDETTKFNLVFDAYIRNKIGLDKSFTKKKITKILKNFTAIKRFKILNKDEINELYNVMEMYLNNIKSEPKDFKKADQKTYVSEINYFNTNVLDFCNNYIDNIRKILMIFHIYENECICSKKFIEENNLDINKDDLKKGLKNSARGRKPKDKKKSKRKVQGSGLYFSSQVTFDMYNYINKKISKIKVFRNGNFQIPGVKKPDMSDLIVPITTLKEYLNYVKELNSEESTIDVKDRVEVPYMISVMRNYTCRIANDNITIILNKLEDVLFYEKAMPIKTSLEKYLEFFEKYKLQPVEIYNIFKYINVGFYNISEISFNSERYAGLLIKFNRPIPNKENKKLTIKVLSSGKINFDGGTSELEIQEIYYWFQYIFIKYWNEITYNSETILNEVISSDSASGYLSIYDDDE